MRLVGEISSSDTIRRRHQKLHQHLERIKPYPDYFIAVHRGLAFY